VVSEIMTNAIQITQADGRAAPGRLWLLADRTQLLILVWDASPLPPVPVSTGDDEENGRGLLLPGAEDSDVGGVHDADEEPGNSGGLMVVAPGLVGEVPG
jgi:anti-sigma regulatory factor (Ser/Thr protein kinase)